MALIMQISTLLEKLPGSVAAFLSRKDTVALFNGKEGTRNTFLCSSGLGTRFLLPPSLKNSRRGSPVLTWLREGSQGKATSKADVKGALAKTEEGCLFLSSPNLCRIEMCKMRRGALLPVHLLSIYPGVYLSWQGDVSSPGTLSSAGRRRKSQASVSSRALIRALGISYR